MKHILSILLGLMVASTAFAQPYKTAIPTASEYQRIAGIQGYLVEDQFATWQLIPVAAGSSTNIIPGFNQNVILMSNDICTATVVLPNPTNSPQAVINVLTTFRTAAILTNGGVGFNIASTTNTTSGAGWLARTNQIIRCINPYGTNWLAIVLSP